MEQAIGGKSIGCSHPDFIALLAEKLAAIGPRPLTAPINPSP